VVKHRRHLVRGLAALLVLVVALGGGWLWVRDSSLARVREVTITGATTSQQDRIRAALESAARDMTTLHVREDALRSAVAAYPSVADLRVEADFPHALAIEVREHRPVAVLRSGDRRVPVAADGIVLTGVRPQGRLPDVRVKALPVQRVDGARARAAVAVAAAAPEPLLARTERLRWGEHGLEADLRDGPPLYFGGREAAAAKWTAAARVLAEPSAAGATYLDLRVPSRVAAGGVGPVPQEDLSAVPQP
jgi:cell division protein FtsQ